MKRWSVFFAVVWGSCLVQYTFVQAIFPPIPQQPTVQTDGTSALPQPDIMGAMPAETTPPALDTSQPALPGITPSLPDPSIGGVPFPLPDQTTSALPNAQQMSSPELAQQPLQADASGITQPQIIAPDTVELPDKEIGIQGNWMKKKEWLKRAYETHDQMQRLAVDIQNSRNAFNQKFNSIDEELDQFYKNYGVQQGKLDELFSNISGFLEKKKQRTLAALAAEKQQDKILERDYQIKVEAIETEVKGNKTSLEQLKLNMQSIEELDRSLAERLTQLDQQINQGMTLVNQGNDTINALWQIIDDSIARTRYYELVNNVFAPLQAIHTYLTSTLQQDFDQVAGTIRQQIAKVLDDTRQLESIGLVLKNRAPRLDDIRLQVKLEREKALQAEREAEAKRKELAQKKTVKKIVPQPWWKKIILFFVSFFSNLYSVITGSETPAPQVRKTTPTAGLAGPLVAQ